MQGRFEDVLAIEKRIESLHPPGEFVPGYHGTIYTFALAQLGRLEELQVLAAQIRTIEAAASTPQQETLSQLDYVEYFIALLNGQPELQRQNQIERGGFINLLDLGFEDDARLVLEYWLERMPGALPFAHVNWQFGTQAQTPQHLRDHPLARRWADNMGYTYEWRLELCKRAATFPPESKINCDPARYAAEGVQVSP